MKFGITAEKKSNHDVVLQPPSTEQGFLSEVFGGKEKNSIPSVWYGVQAVSDWEKGVNDVESIHLKG